MSAAATAAASHQAIADRWHLDMADPFTRVFVAACYWQERAEFWKRKAQEAERAAEGLKREREARDVKRST